MLRRSTQTEFSTRRFLVGAAGFFLLIDIAPANDRGASLFSEQIQPVLAKSCLGCHSAQAKQGGLDLSSREALLRGGDPGPAIVPGNAGQSLLYKLIARKQEPAMPYKAGPIPNEAVDKFADWI